MGAGIEGSGIVLLDRRRINKWAKWIAIALVIAFGLGFVAFGVGTGHFNVADLWNRGDNRGRASAGTPEAAIASYEAILATDPDNQDALLGIANEYRKEGNLTREAEYLERLAVLQPGKGEFDLRLASIYMNQEVQNYSAAVKALLRATALDPNNADAFLQLGIAERSAGNSNGAILAWSRYLTLAPDGEMAQTVREAIDQMKPTTTTTGDVTTSTT